MTQPIDIIASAYRSIGALASGETVEANAANDAFALLNEMLDQWSNDHMLVFVQQEVIQELVGGKYIYTIGAGGDVGAVFTGSVAGTVLTVAGPFISGAICVGQILSSPLLPAGLSITSYGTGRGGNVSGGALGTYNLNLPGPPAPPPPGLITAYTPRPLRVNSAIVRVVNSISGTLDYPVAVVAFEEYQMIGIKTLPGPWPRLVYYQPTEPLGILSYWPNPSQGEMHLYVDTVLNQFSTINDTITLPQGYRAALHWSLAELLMPEYGKKEPTQIALVSKYAAQGRAFVKRTNQHPQMPSRFDDAMVAKSRKDAGWILHGGFA